MQVDAITVCIGYGDFLQETARHNRGLFDRWLIVTSPDDKETREVARRYSLPTLITEDHHRGEGAFNKGLAIQRGLTLSRHDGWIIHIDADIVLPPSFRSALESAQLDPECIYGFDRVMVPSWEEWQRFQASGYLQHDYHYRLNFPPGFKVGTRWCHPTHGYVPIGFGQLFHGSAVQYHGITHRPYPAHHTNAARSDVAFGLQWDRRHRQLLPEIVAIHLESEPAKLGANWEGRTTKRFGPAPFGSEMNASAS